MTSKALLVGIDDYTGHPLTSAVNDAVAFKSSLIALGLEAEANITLLTSPPQKPGDALPNSTVLIKWLYDNVYVRGDALERFIFFFAGHGLLAFSDSAKTRTRTAILPCDVEDLNRDGRLLIDFTGLMDVLQLTGPQEQLYFVDACRDMSYAEQPDVTSLGWAAKPLGTERSQSCLYAVSPLGKARGSHNGMGVMTTFVIEGLKAQGIALEFDSTNFQYVVTTRSVGAHSREKVRQGLLKEPVWTQKYQLPTFVARGPEATPLFTFKQVAPVPLTVHIEPDDAADQTQVKFCVGNYPLAEKYCYPINRNHQPVQLEPQRHLMLASSQWGTPVPSRAPIDLRTTREVTIQVALPAAPGGPVPSGNIAAPVPDTGMLPPKVSSTIVAPVSSGLRFWVAPEPGDYGYEEYQSELVQAGIIEAQSLEAQAEISIRGLSPPYPAWTGTGHLRQQVPAGQTYKIQFRLGTDVFSEQDVFVRLNETLVVEPPASITPLLQEFLGVGAEIPTSVQISESIGPMQAGLLSTLLPIIGIKPFDLGNSLFRQFSGLIDPRPSISYGNQPLSLVLAVDGNSWNVPVSEIVDGIRCTIVLPHGGGSDSLRLEPLLPRDGSGRGLQRVCRAIATAPVGSFALQLESQILGQLSVCSAGLTNRATVVTAVFRPDGSIDLSQNILRLPGWQYPDEPPQPPETYGRLLRTLQIGQALYQSGEMFAAGEPRASLDTTTELLNYARNSKWLDPVLGCMAYYATARALAADSLATDFPIPGTLQRAASNLYRYFPDLPDTRVIHGREFASSKVELYSDLLNAGALPLLAESAWELARYALETGREDAPIVRFSRSVVPDQPWLRVPLLVNAPAPAEAEN